MATTKNTSSSTVHSTTTSSSAAAKPRTKTRKPPVAERITVSAALAVPSATVPAPAAAPPASPPATSTSGASAPAAPGGSASTGAAAGAAISAPPQVTIPAVPGGFVPVNAADLKGFRPMASQVAAVPDAIAELGGFANYPAVFGITAPDVAQVTQRLSVAYQWTMLLSQTAAWYKYAKSQQGMAWKDALPLVDSLKAPFDLAETANPAMLSQYPALARLLDAKSVVAKRAASTRAKGKTAPTATATSGAPAGSSTGQAPAAAPAAPVETSGASTNGAAAPAATRLVTVQG